MPDREQLKNPSKIVLLSYSIQFFFYPILFYPYPFYSFCDHSLINTSMDPIKLASIRIDWIDAIYGYKRPIKERGKRRVLNCARFRSI